MPIYNGIEFITESVNSVINQSFENWELIIGINGHENNSAVYQTAYKFQDEKIRVFDMSTKGKVDTLNEMIKYCSFDWFAILDVDDYWMNNKLEKQLPYMKDYGVIGTKCVYFGDSSDIPYIKVGDLSSFNFLDFNTIINSSSLLKKELCVWEDNFFGIEDYNLWLKLWRQNTRFYNVDEVLVKHRIHRASAFNAKGNDNFVDELKKKYT